MTGRALRATVAVLLAAGCGDVLNPEDQVLAGSELLVLGQQATAPAPQAATFWVLNSTTSAHTVLHADEFNTPFLTVTFPPGCLRSVGSQSVGQADSVLVTIQPSARRYRFTLAPTDLVLTTACRATARLSFGRYGDLGVADGSSTYLDRGAYAAALDLWWEVGPDRWRMAPESGPAGNEAVAGILEAGGTYILAAPR